MKTNDEISYESLQRILAAVICAYGVNGTLTIPARAQYESADVDALIYWPVGIDGAMSITATNVRKTIQGEVVQGELVAGGVG